MSGNRTYSIRQILYDFCLGSMSGNLTYFIRQIVYDYYPRSLPGNRTHLIPQIAYDYCPRSMSGNRTSFTASQSSSRHVFCDRKRRGEPVYCNHFNTFLYKAVESINIRWNIRSLVPSGTNWTQWNLNINTLEFFVLFCIGLIVSSFYIFRAACYLSAFKYSKLLV